MADLKIGLDVESGKATNTIKGLQNEWEKSQKKVEEYKKTVESLEKQIESVTNKIKKDISKFFGKNNTQALENALKSIEDVDLQNLKNDLDKTNKQLIEAQSNSDMLKTKLDELSKKQIKNILPPVENNQQIKLSKNLIDSESITKSANETAKTFVSATSSAISKQSSINLAKSLEMEEANAKIKKYQAEWEKSTQKVERQKQKISELNKELEEHNKKLEKAKEAGQDISKDKWTTELQQRLKEANTELERLEANADLSRIKLKKAFSNQLTLFTKDIPTEPITKNLINTEDITNSANEISKKLISATSSAISNADIPISLNEKLANYFKTILPNSIEVSKRALVSLGNVNEKITSAISNVVGKAFGGIGSLITKATSSLAMFGSRILKLATYTFVFTVINSAFRDLREYIGYVIDSNDELSANLKQVQGNLAVAFQPIIESIIPLLVNFTNWLAKATQHVGAFLSALFGKSYQQEKENAKQLYIQQQIDKKIGKQNKGLQKQHKIRKDINKETLKSLAKFDELNVIEQDKDKGKKNLDNLNAISQSANDTAQAMADIQKNADLMFGGTEDTSKAETWGTKVRNGFIKAGEGIKTYVKNAETFVKGKINKTLEKHPDIVEKLKKDIEEEKKGNYKGPPPVMVAELKTVANLVTDNLGEVTQKGIDKINEQVEKGILPPDIGEGLKKPLEAYDHVRQYVEEHPIIGEHFNQNLEKGMDLASATVVAGFETAGTFIGEESGKIWNNITTSASTAGDTVKTALTTAGTKVGQKWDGFKTEFSKNMGNVGTAVSTAGTKIKENFNTARENVGQKWGQFGNWFSERTDDIKQGVSTAGTKIKESFDTARENVGQKWGDINTWFSERMEDVKKSAGTVGGNIQTAFETAKTNASKSMEELGNKINEIFSDPYGTVIKPFINGILWLFERGINKIISGWNWFSRKISNWGFTLPDWLGGHKISIPSLPEIADVNIPRLASGAVIPPNSPFLAMLGDQRSGTNIEAPLDTIKQAFVEALSENGGYNNSGSYTFVAQLDGRTIFEETIRQNDMYKYQAGYSAFA